MNVATFQINFDENLCNWHQPNIIHDVHDKSWQFQSYKQGNWFCSIFGHVKCFKNVWKYEIGLCPFDT